MLGMHVKVRGQLVAIGSLYHMDFRDLPQGVRLEGQLL